MSLSKGDKNIATLLTDIDTLLREGKKFEDSDIDSLSSSLANMFKDRLKAREPRKNLSMSMIGKPTRQLWLSLQEAAVDKTEELSSQQRLLFLFGDILEILLLWLAEQSGHTVTDKQRVVELEGVKGSIDCIIDGALVDVKSASNNAFQMFKNATVLGEDGTDYLGYHHQIQGYNLGLSKQGTDVTDVAFFCINKSTGELCLYQPDQDFDLPPDVEKRIKELQVKLKSSEVPPRCYNPKVERKTDKLYLNKACSYCPHKYYCWFVKEINDKTVQPRYYVEEKEKSVNNDE